MKIIHTSLVISLWLLVLTGGFFLVSEVSLAGSWQSFLNQHMPITTEVDCNGQG